MASITQTDVKYNAFEPHIVSRTQGNSQNQHMTVHHSHGQVLPGQLDQYRTDQLESLIQKLAADIDCYKTISSGIFPNMPPKYAHYVQAAQEEQNADQTLLDRAKAILQSRVINPLESKQS